MQKYNCIQGAHAHRPLEESVDERETPCISRSFEVSWYKLKTNAVSSISEFFYIFTAKKIELIFHHLTDFSALGIVDAKI